MTLFEQIQEQIAELHLAVVQAEELVVNASSEDVRGLFALQLASTVAVAIDYHTNVALMAMSN